MARRVTSILFVMYDQLRHDYLGCAGHPALKTPNFDRLAAMGVRFGNAHVQSPVCGASRMSFYTGRYVSSHGAAWNNYPLKVGEQTLGDHLRRAGMDAFLVGKTHMRADLEGMARLGLDTGGIIGARLAECGFDVIERDDGLWAEGPDGFYDRRRSPYNEWLKERGYPSANPWADFANAGIDEGGAIASGWFMRNAARPANIREEESETPWLTDRAIAFLDERATSDRPWLCHLSYIKPHWPYIVPAPWHALYGPADVQPAIRDERERATWHPIHRAFANSTIGRAFARDEVRARVIPAYMGLIAQCDHHFGRLLDHLEASGRLADTMIVLTSDHGDYLGDHWLGEKDLFHDPSVKVPLIVYDPSPEADARRGTVCDALVEAIDLAPTFLDALGAPVPDHVLEGRSLLPFLRDENAAPWRGFVVSEYDWSCSPAAEAMGVAPRDARLFMIADERWKFVHAEGGFRSVLFDRKNDPHEFDDLGADPAHRPTIERMYERLGRWARRMAQRTTVTDDEIRARRGGSGGVGILLGVYDEHEISEEERRRYTGRAPARFTPPD